MYILALFQVVTVCKEKNCITAYFDLRAQLFKAPSSYSWVCINFNNYCYLFMATGGFATKLWPNKVINHKYFIFLKP